MSNWKYSVLVVVSLLASACGLSDDAADSAIDTVKIATKAEVPSGTKLVVAEQASLGSIQSLPWTGSTSACST